MKRTQNPRFRARGVTLLEVIFTLVMTIVGAIIVAAIIIAMSGPGRIASPQLKDSSQVRGILQGLVLYAQSNGDRYALPSTIDIDNATVSESGTAKDTSANIYSLLMWNGLVTAELLMSPVETGNIEKYEGYELSNPKAAVNPGKALWDPAFRADFTGKEPGGVSYAHMLPGAARAGSWANTFKSTEITIANRGPRIQSVTHNADGSIGTIDADKNSVTYQFHDNGDAWTGNIGYNDNHVKFEKSMSPKEITYLNVNGKAMADTIFYDEPDDPTGTNAFLSLFITAGDQKSDFKSIWD